MQFSVHDLQTDFEPDMSLKVTSYGGSHQNLQLNDCFGKTCNVFEKAQNLCKL